MAELEKKPVKIVETILRDAHQSQIATRMTTEQMLPIVDKLDKVGYHAVECWGGATFDASLRFLHEDPWERLRKCVTALRTQTSDAFPWTEHPIPSIRRRRCSEYFEQKSSQNGIDIIRIFDCLNDLPATFRQLKSAQTKRRLMHR